MQLITVTDKGKTGSFFAQNNEILFIDWNQNTIPNFFTFDEALNVRQIDEDYFLITIVGNHYKKIGEQLSMPIWKYQQAKGKNGEIFFCCFQNDEIYGFDNKGNRIFEWIPEIGKGHPIYDIKFQAPYYLWLAFPTGQTVTQISLKEKREVYTIGDYNWEENSTNLLSFPESVFIDDRFLYITNKESKKVFKVDLNTKALEPFAEFEEGIWQYEKTRIGSFVTTDIGIYKVVS